MNWSHPYTKISPITSGTNNENSNYQPIDHSRHKYPKHNVVEDGIMSGVYIIFAVDSHHFPEGRGSFLYFLDL